MENFMVLFWCCMVILSFIISLFVSVLLVCFFRLFYSPRRREVENGEYPLPDGEEYKPFHDEIYAWIKEMREKPHEDVSVTSFDGLTLRGRYYEYSKDSPLEILFHGYRGNAERDLSAGVERCFALGRSVIIVDQRASGRSDGHIISFGINERRDCRTWIDFAKERFGEERELIISGVSMGAATVMMAAGEPLPSSVKCVLADCGYTSAEAIIKKVMRDMKLPADLLYPFAKLAARLFGKFNLDEYSPIEAMQTAKIPIIFIHGDRDSFVPCAMSEVLHEVCASKVKRLVKVSGAAHGIAYPHAKEYYVKALADFEPEWRSNTWRLVNRAALDYKIEDIAEYKPWILTYKKEQG